MHHFPRALLGGALAACGFLLASCGGGSDGNPYAARPTFLVGEPQRTDYDGVTNGLLTGKAGSLQALVTYALPAAPTAADLRTAALQSSYTGLLDVTPAGGFGTYYGKLTAGANAGAEYIAVADDGSGTQNVTVAVAIPANFDRTKPCLVAIPSSGSRPVYGEMGTIGEWALNKGCAVALTDKGTGMGVHDLERDQAFAIDGTPVSAGTRKDLTFNANLADDLASFKAANPNRFALKHAHGKQNPEKDWGRFTLQAIRTGLYVLNKHFAPAEFQPSNTMVIAASISNGGGAALRAAEQDSDRLIAGVVAAEPQINLPENAGVTVRRGGSAVGIAGRPLLDYTTFAGLYQSCAVQSDALKATSAFVIAPFAANRCATLKTMGLVNGGTLQEQSADALARLHAYGWEPEADLLHDSHAGSEFADLVSHTYMNAYARASVKDSLCGLSVAGIDAAFKVPVAPGAAAMRGAWASGGGLGYLAGAYNIAYDNSVGGPALYLLGVSPSSKQPDLSADAVACMRRMATNAASGNVAIGAAEQAVAARVRSGIDEVRVNGNLRGKPVVILHGRSDALLPVNHTSRPYMALNARVDGASTVRYYEVTDANHFDALVGLYPRTLVPLHVYTLRALDLMYAKLASGAELPASQVVRAAARSGPAATLTDAHVPAISAAPPEANRIQVGSGTIDVPN